MVKGLAVIEDVHVGKELEKLLVGTCKWIYIFGILFGEWKSSLLLILC